MIVQRNVHFFCYLSMKLAFFMWLITAICGDFSAIIRPNLRYPSIKFVFYLWLFDEIRIFLCNLSMGNVFLCYPLTKCAVLCDLLIKLEFSSRSFDKIWVFTVIFWRKLRFFAIFWWILHLISDLFEKNLFFFLCYSLTKTAFLDEICIFSAILQWNWCFLFYKLLAKLILSIIHIEICLLF